jgi:hypothetical protein
MKDNTAWMRVYSTEHIANMSYVTKDGNYGSDEVYVFPSKALTAEQWEILDKLHDSDKIHFVHDVIEGEDLSQWDEYKD